ncbi:MAG: 4-(cytidine 5'-diphospho)-2-C-methyl-D-erythritol kinase [Desulfobulbaceae bacterium]|nr:4-(cytidine 5'-diphospho)-2-C-methyl-D-erythritol kinase [Desulfobulbaceae bacterium]
MKVSEKTIQAPAKINLCLAVKGKRSDGYHELESVMQKLELADIVRIRVEEGTGISLSCPGSDLPEDRTNLVWQAARLLIDEAGVDCRVIIILEKNIPVSAGLGGGSSDAAAVLLALDDLLLTNLGEERLLGMALQLGADVPFFIKKNLSAALAKGVGERLTAVPGIHDCEVILVKPGFGVSTKWVFDNLALTTNSNPYILAPEKDCLSDRYSGSEVDFLKQAGPAGFFNDLESVTVAHYPEIAEIKKLMLADGALVSLMSGSGPTVFGIFTDNCKAVACYKKFGKRYGHNVFLTAPNHS